MENEQLTKDFLDFLDLYQSENYAEHLHNALYYVSQEVSKDELTDGGSFVLFITLGII